MAVSRNPLVTVICLCFNHEKFVLESLQSIISQSYPNIELIIVDDGSHDNSPKIIKKFTEDYPQVKFKKLPKNKGNCAAFNVAFREAKGEFIIDLAADDKLLAHAISTQVKAFKSNSTEYGVVFSDAELIDENSKSIKTFYNRDKNGKLISEVPSGEIYNHLIRKMVICSPTMMMRKKVLDELGGYDESLSYEDYDFWVRSGRNHKYHFINEVLIQKRVISNSSTSHFYKKRNNRHLHSTLRVCYKAFDLNKTKKENHALAVSIRYHLKLSLFTENFPLVVKFFKLLKQTDDLKIKDRIILFLGRIKFPANGFYRFYFKLKYGKKI
ncbi:MAG: glycosyltransferase [Flammeovirgaceae bacterium]|nr:glycosyltransferase [Flammeovirgaceae bacterium]